MATSSVEDPAQPGGRGGLPAGGPRMFLVGPTAVGKTALSLGVAERMGAEIVSMDSMLVYRGMDIGTAKPDAADRKRVVHHGLDLVEPPTRFDVQMYLAHVQAVEAEARARGRRLLFVGGTGFYLKALTQGLFDGPEPDLTLRRTLEQRAEEEGCEVLHAELARVDPESAERLHQNDVRRVVRALEVHEQTGRRLSEWQVEWKDSKNQQNWTIVGLCAEDCVLDARIQERTAAMLAGGWVEEARAVRDGPGFGPSSIQALGYSQVLALADGDRGLVEVEAEINQKTRRFSRRQGTWFRNFPEIQWIDADGAETAEVARLLGEN